jgi:hypothetical protein
LNPSIDRNIKIVQQLEQVSRPHCIMFKRDGGGGGDREQHLPITQFLQKKKTTKNTTTLVFGRKHLIIHEFSLFKEVLGPKPHKKNVISEYISL